MAAGESQAWSWAARGCARRSCFVCFLYDFRASLKSRSKLEDEEAMGCVWGILCKEMVGDGVDTEGKSG